MQELVSFLIFLCYNIFVQIGNRDPKITMPSDFCTFIGRRLKTRKARCCFYAQVSHFRL
uniref:Uncharacterized protein n=1 Tax=virus sp. ctHG14 TaxID=2827626 RepID=A0A8S5RIN5_9VIRU|nr:MAG TPA: hypothetical protein [virus sp. ctHG14]DAI17848.1 MAG TPA: hypothetical protein [Bacteriophage sp.]DAT56758.1 MAG TPA: hypothetical protein [Bacteriophage sp.]DAW42547.1 MAG TPA: hypothetical protein [Bacteriophage sp.]DAX00998.1 MAG TPA: hypothetical protein [Bacteriophage sp.]